MAPDVVGSAAGMERLLQQKLQAAVTRPRGAYAVGGLTLGTRQPASKKFCPRRAAGREANPKGMAIAIAALNNPLHDL